MQNDEVTFYLLGLILGHKKIQILRFLVENCDKNKQIHITYEQIMQKNDVSKPTVASFFKQMQETRVLKKLKNSFYQLNF